MFWFRVDNRLVHGQIIEAWLPYTDAGYLLVANDALAAAPLQQQIILLAVPNRVRVCFVPLIRLADTLNACDQGKNIFVLLATCADAVALCAMGVAMAELNIGNLHYAPGKRRILPHVAVSEEEIADLRQLDRWNVRLDFRCTPSETGLRLDVALA